MGQDIQKITSLGRLQLDADEKRIKEDESPYRLNVERAVNNKDAGMGGSSGIKTPVPANRMLPVELPAGVNTTIKSYEAKRTGETYVFVHNSNLNHTLYRIKRDLSVQIVYTGPELGLSLDPQFMPRVHLFFNPSSSTENQNKVFRKYLAYTTGEHWQKYIDVETSIATESFNTPYFITSDKRQLIELATRPPLDCIEGQFVTDELADPSAINKMVKKTWQFRQKFIYTDGRPTAWGPISSTFIIEASPCQLIAEGLPTCIDLKLDAGGPHVEKIVLAFRNCAGRILEDQASEWFEYDTFEKYSVSLDSGQPFYERTVRTDMGYDPGTNRFTYRFCGNKKCVPVSRTETNQNFIPIPIESYALVPLDDRLMLLNNEKGFNPISRESLEKVSFTSQEPVIMDCKIEMVTVKFAVIIHNQAVGLNQFIYISEDDLDNYDTHNKLFGGLGRRSFAASPWDNPVSYRQFFPDKKQRGFIVYIEGTPYHGVTKQYRSYGMTIMTQEAQITALANGYAQRSRSKELTDNEYYFIQTGEIQVPKGTRGYLRLASQSAERSGQYQDTSTTVLGVLRNRENYRAPMHLTDAVIDMTQKEIYFDTCNGAADMISTPFVIEDVTWPQPTISFGDAATALTGYLKDKDGRPISGAEVVPFGSMNTGGSLITDHNGFFHISTAWEGGIYTGSYGLEFFTEGPGCVRRKLADYVEGPGSRPNETLFREVIVQDEAYNTNWYATVEVLVQDTNGLPIPGISIAAAGVKARTTNANGRARLFVRQNMLNYGDTQTLRVVVMQSGLCFLTTGNCNSCMPIRDVILPACLAGPVEITIEDIPAFNTIGSTRGLQPGGLYPLALKFIDAAGRETFAQGDYQVQLPSTQQKGVDGFSFIRWDVAGNMNLPREFVKMAILIGKNRLWDEVIEWVADKVEFVDSLGKTATNVSADKIRISIQSLYETQTDYNLAYNAKYQFVPGDKLQVVANADGVIFDDPVESLTFTIETDYNNRDIVDDIDPKDPEQTPTERFTYLVIPYSKILENLKAGAKIRIIRDGACMPEDTYYETCPLIDIVDGEPVAKSGTVNAFDSYFVRRMIRYEEMMHSFTFPFLHHSPSDFWGDHCIDRGRISVRNPYEKKIRYGRNAMISANLLANGNYNGLNVYSEDLSKTFSGEQRGDIVYGVSVEQVIMLICEFDNMVARVADDFVRIGPDGILKALGAEAVIGDAELKIRGFFGCQYGHVKSILHGNGFVWWFDGHNAAPILHDFQEARNVAIGSTEGYFQKKNQLFLGTGGDVICGYDAVARSIYTTFFHPGSDSYVHSRPEIDYSKNETITFSLVDGLFYDFKSFTPQMYGTLMQASQGKLFVTFREGQPYLHREMSNTLYNEFYGTPVDQVLEFVVNQNPDKVKRYLAMQIQSTYPYWSDRILTSEGQISLIPPVRAQNLSEGKHDNNFLGARNSPGGLHQGHQLHGYWMRVRLVRENSNNFVVGTKNPAKQVLYSELDSILIKFFWSEQSGYGTNNNR